MMQRLTFTALAAWLLAASLLIAGCEDEGPAEQAGEKIDDAAEETQESAEDAADSAGDAVEEGADEAEDATD